MAALKTQPTKSSVKVFLDSIEDDAKRKDAKRLAKMMREVTEQRAKMWGANVVGYGSYQYKYASGRAGEWFRVGFSPRKSNITLYIMPGFSGAAGLLKKLGKHKTGKSCLYINKLADVDLEVLRTLIDKSFVTMEKRYPSLSRS